MWFKVDDGFWSHPKVLALSPEAVALWVRAGSYCGQHLTDGRLPSAILPVVGNEAAAAELVAAGLWIAEEAAYQFHDWAKYQPSREDVEKDRQANADRQRAYRERRRNATNAGSNGERNALHNGERNDVTNNVSNPVSNDPPTRPDPTRPDHVTTEVVTSPKPSLEPLFERAYAAWPKKVERKKSLDKFKAKAKMFADPIELVEHIERFGAAYEATTERQYTPALNVWLNGERWTDELPQADLDNPWATPAPARSESPTDAARRVADQLREMEGTSHDAQRGW